MIFTGLLAVAAVLTLTTPFMPQIVDASWCGEELRGSLMANGKPFVPEAWTCATWDFPLGSLVKASYKGREVIMEVTDRGPNKRLVAEGRRIDLSRGSWDKLRADPDQGVIRVEIIRLR